MKPGQIAVLVDLMTNKKSEYRRADEGELRVAGSTNFMGTFEIGIKYNKEEMHVSGHAGRQYVTMKQEGHHFLISLTRPRGGIIKEHEKVEIEYSSMLSWFNNWVSEVAKEENAPSR